MIIHLSQLSITRLEGGLTWLSLTPRLLLPLSSLLAALLGASSCVPATRYEEAQSAAEVGSEAHRRSQLELETQKARVAALEAELRAREQKLHGRDQDLEEAKLARGSIEKEREASVSLVDQLRGELSRAGDHLQTFSEQNTRLERELEKARAAPSGVDPSLVSLATELGVAIGARGLQQVVSVSAREGALHVAVRAEALFEPKSAEPRTVAPAAFDAAVRLLMREPRLFVVVRETEPDATAAPALGRERREALEAGLRARGAGERVKFSSDEAAAAGAPRIYELVLTTAPEPSARPE